MTARDAFRIVLIISAIEGVLALIGMCALAYAAFREAHEDAAILTALGTLTGTMIASLGTILFTAKSRVAGEPPLVKPTESDEPPPLHTKD